METIRNHTINQRFLTEYQAGMTVDPAKVQTEEERKAFFFETEIWDGLFERMKGKSFKEDCTIPRETLRYILSLIHIFRYRSAPQKYIIG